MTDTYPSLPSRLKGWLRAAVTYDCFSEFSKKVRRFVYHPLGVLSLATLASLLCGMFLHPQGEVPRLLRFDRIARHRRNGTRSEARSAAGSPGRPKELPVQTG
jgi:hypothetical protein